MNVNPSSNGCYNLTTPTFLIITEKDGSVERNGVLGVSELESKSLCSQSSRVSVVPDGPNIVDLYLRLFMNPVCQDVVRLLTLIVNIVTWIAASASTTALATATYDDGPRSAKYSMKSLIAVRFDSLITNPQFLEMLESTCVCSEWGEVDRLYDERRTYLIQVSSKVFREDSSSQDRDGYDQPLVLSYRVAALLILANTLSTDSVNVSGLRIQSTRLNHDFYSRAQTVVENGFATEMIGANAVQPQPCHKIGRYYYVPNGYLHQYVYHVLIGLIRQYSVANEAERPILKSQIQRLVNEMFDD